MDIRGLFRLKREKGVATIVGTILILLAAVIIMVSVFAVLNTLPAQSNSMATVKMQNMGLQNSEDPLGSAGYMVVSFLYESGPVLYSSSSNFVVYYNNQSYVYPLSSLGLSAVRQGTEIDFNSSNMSSPDIINGKMPLVVENSPVGIALVQYGRTVWSSSKFVGLSIVKPVIANSWVSGYTGQNFNLYASVYSSYPISVTGDFSDLYGSSSYSNTTFAPVVNDTTFEVHLPAVKDYSYYEIMVWTKLPSGKGGVVDQWYSLSQGGSAVLSLNVVDINFYVRGLPGTIWAGNTLPVKISGAQTPPAAPPALGPSIGLPPWYGVWMNLDRNNTTLSTLGYQTVGVTGVDQYLTINDSGILSVAWDGAQFVSATVVDNGVTSVLSSLQNSVVLIPSSGIVNIYVNFTSVSRIVMVGGSGLYNQSEITYTLTVGGVSNTYGVSASSLLSVTPVDTYSYQVGSPEQVQVTGLSSDVGQDIFAVYANGTAFNVAALTPGQNLTVKIGAVPFENGNVTFDVYGFPASVNQEFQLVYSGVDYAANGGQLPVSTEVRNVPFGKHAFSVPQVLYGKNGIYKYVLQAETVNGITVSSNGNGTFSVVYLDQVYSLYYANITIYYNVIPVVNPVGAGGLYYVVNGQSYYNEHSFESGSIVTFNAYSTSKYFAYGYMTGSISGSDSGSSSFSMKLTGNDTELAVFIPMYVLTVSVEGYGEVSITVDNVNGTVSHFSVGNSGAIVVFPIESGSAVQMVESPLYGSSFEGFSGWYSTSSGSFSSVLSSNSTETASFTGGHPPREVTVTVNGTGTAYFDGYSTTTSRTITVAQGTVLTITESPGANYKFMDYSGSYVNTTDVTATITVISNGTEYVNFQPISISLQVLITPSGGGSATVNGHVDTSSYALSIPYGSTVQITEKNANGYSFSDFSGYYYSTKSSITFTLTSNSTEYVAFSVVYVSVNVQVLPSGIGGNVLLSYDGANTQTSSQVTISVPWGTSVSLSAYAGTGYYFASYSGTYGSYNNGNSSITVTSNGVEDVNFYLLAKYTVVVDATPSGGGGATIQGAAIGTTSSSESFTVYSGSVLDISESTSNSNFVFSGFSGAFGSSSNTVIAIMVTGNGTEYVNFQYIWANVTLAVSPSSGGTVSYTVQSGGGSGSTSTSTVVKVLIGNSITLSEVSSYGYSFNDWSGDLGSSTSSPVTFTVGASGAEQANFQSHFITVTVKVNPSGDGNVQITTATGKIYSTSTVWTGSVVSGSQLSLSASNSVQGWVFSSFGGIYQAGSSTVNFDPISSGTEYANFSSDAHVFTLTVDSTNYGTVSIVLGGSSFSTSGTEQITYYSSSTSVSLSETPNSNYAFEGWSGYSSGSGTTLTFTLVGNGTVYANFKQLINYYTVSISVSPSGGGSFSVNGSSYVTSFNQQVPQGSSITINEQPGSAVGIQYEFSDYSGTYNSANTQLTFTVNGGVSETVYFTATALPQYSVTVVVNPYYVGSVNVEGAAAYFGLQTQWTFNGIYEGSSISLSEGLSNSNFEFTGYSGTYGSSSSSYFSFVVNSGGTEYVNYEYKWVYLNLAVDPPGDGTIYYNGQSTINTLGPYQLLIGSSVTLSESPASQYAFNGWSGVIGNSGSSSFSGTVNSNGTEYANFQGTMATVDVQVNPSGAGNIYVYNAATLFNYYTGDSGWSGSVPIGTQILVRAFDMVPGNGYAFNGFSGIQQSSSTSITFTVPSGGGTEYVNYHSNMHYLTLIVSSYNYGTATVTFPNGTQQSVTTTGTFGYSGASEFVGFYESPSSGYDFSSWSGADGYSTSTTLDFTLQGNGTVTANFAARTSYTFYVDITNYAFGDTNVIVNGNPVSYSGQPFTYIANTYVSIEASAGGGYTFQGFSGTYGSGSGSSLNFYLTRGGTVTASFAAPAATDYTLYVQVSPGINDGTVTGPNGGFNNQATFIEPSGSTITLSESPASGYSFSDWSGPVSSTASSITVIFSSSMNGQTEYANFAQQTVTTYSVTISAGGPGTVSFTYNGHYYKTGSWGSNSVSLNVPSGTQLTLNAKTNPGSATIINVYDGSIGTYGNFGNTVDPVSITILKSGYEEGVFSQTRVGFTNYSGNSTGFGALPMGGVPISEGFAGHGQAWVPVMFNGTRP